MGDTLEKMGDFFDKRADGYEKHMLENVDGADQFYSETASLIPLVKGLKLLDLGCGSGLELDEIFKLNSTVFVTGIDLSANMLELLKSKHIDQADRLNLIQGSYFDVDFGVNVFDAAVSVETMHHFSHEKKISLYKKIQESLKSGSRYVETDYTAPSQEREDFFYAENKRLRSELGITDGFYHYDTPCTVENQLEMLKKAGFRSVNLHRKYENTSIFIAEK